MKKKTLPQKYWEAEQKGMNYVDDFGRANWLSTIAYRHFEEEGHVKKLSIKEIEKIIRNPTTRRMGTIKTKDWTVKDVWSKTVEGCGALAEAIYNAQKRSVKHGTPNGIYRKKT